MRPAWKTLVLLFVAAVSAHSAPAPLVFTGLSAEEQSTLDQGRALIRQAASSRSLSLAAAGPFAGEIRDRIRSLGANYIGEVIMVIPADTGSSGLLQSLASDLANVEGYVGIPYWSRQNNRTYDLFDKMLIVERTTQSNGQSVVAEQHMEPFDTYRARYTCDFDGVELRFRSENLTKISYKGFNAVAPGNMVWYLYAFSQEKATYLYGVGALKAFDLFGVFGERLKTSFMGRIQAFFSYMYEKSKKRNR